MKKLFLFDIEGTTTDINFVHKVLFPYSRERLQEFVHSHQNEANVKEILKIAQNTILEEDQLSPNLDQIVSKLLHWIDTDRKHPALKELQGLIWEFGYKNSDFTGHLYDDVLPFFKTLKNRNIQIGIYSSGSVWAQKLIFKYSDFGDLSSYIDLYFDTKVGHKREVSSYLAISEISGYSPSEITFFSDIKEELEAASQCEFQCYQLERYNVEKSHFKTLTSFRDFIF